MAEFDTALLGIDYLVYSSHKTATQTLAGTLRANGYGCTHCHSLTNRTVNLKSGDFGPFLAWYHRVNGRTLRVITLFREPVERSVSSFFQWHGEGVIRQGLVGGIADTIIATLPTEDLLEVFIRELRSDPPEGHARVGRLESLDQICAELDVGIGDLHYEPFRGYGVTDLDHCTLYLARFDTLAGSGVEKVLTEITGTPITRYDANISAQKWYAEAYQDFRAALRMPRDVLLGIYAARRPIIDVMYPGEYDAMTAAALDRYC